MSIKPKHTWAPAPSTERGRPTQLSADSKGERLAYAAGKSVFLRSIDEPAGPGTQQYTGHNAAATVARFSPSGFYVASGDTAGTVRVWDSSPGGEGATKGEYHITRSITDLAWDGDSQRIIAVGDGKERFGHCFTADSGNSVGEISGHSAPINSVSVRQQRPLRAATASDDTTLVFYHGAPFKFNTSLRGNHARFIYGVAFSPDGSTLVSVGADKKIWLYDGKTGEARGQIGADEHKGSIFSVSWAKDSKRFVTSSADQTVKIWDVEAGKSVQSWRLGPETVSVPDHQVGVVWPARSDNLVISLSLSGALNYLAEGEAKPRRVVYGHQKSVTSLAAVPSPPTMWSGSTDGRVLSWPLEGSTAGSAVPVDGESHKNYVSGIAASAASKVYSVGWDDTLRAIDAGATTFTGTSGTATDGQPRAVATAGDAVVVGTHKGLEVFAADGASSLSKLSTTFSITCLAATTSGPRETTLVAAGADDAVVRIYTLSGGKKLESAPLKELPQPTSQPSTLAFSHDGRSLAVGFANGKITVYDVASWDQSITRWSAHTGRISAIVWRSDDKFAVSGALDTHVYVWSVEKPGSRISALNAHKDGVNAVAWATGGSGGAVTSVLSAGTDGAVKGWTVQLS